MTHAFEDRKGLAHEQFSGEGALYRLAEIAAEFGAEHIATTARSTAERVSEGRFYVACVGQFKRGKSTLLNALIGYSVLPTAVVPVTAVPTIIRYGERLAARVRFQGATWTDIPVDAVEKYVSEEKNPENAKRVEGVEIFVPSPLLETGMCLVDTPGLGSVFAGNTSATHEFIPHIDAAVVVIGADPPLSGDELQLVETVSHDVGDLVFVLNKADRTSSADRSAAVAFARGVLEKRLKRTEITIFEVSALDRLEQRGPDRDWGQLDYALQAMVLESGCSLVCKAADRGIRRAANQLQAVIREERDALERPVAESELRIGRLRETLQESETAMRDLGVLLSAEQQRLSRVFVERRKFFLKEAQVNAHIELNGRLPRVNRRGNGVTFRRNLNHLAQEVARAQLAPWLEGEAKFAEESFQRTARRFVELANEFLDRLEKIKVPGLEKLPPELDGDQELSAKSQFRFHVIERVAAPASPLLFVSDLLLGGIGFRGGIVRAAHEFLDQLLEVNSSRVQGDVDERLRESRKKLDAEIRQLLREASAIAERALARARTAQAAGAPGMQAALARLNALELEVQESMSWGSRRDGMERGRSKFPVRNR